jgi:hypothetical protein
MIMRRIFVYRMSVIKSGLLPYLETPKMDLEALSVVAADYLVILLRFS